MFMLEGIGQIKTTCHHRRIDVSNSLFNYTYAIMLGNEIII